MYPTSDKMTDHSEIVVVSDVVIKGHSKSRWKTLCNHRDARDSSKIELIDANETILM